MSDTAAVKKLLAEGEEAASFIKTFVVQAKLNERGNFGESASGPKHFLQGLCRTNIIKPSGTLRVLLRVAVVGSCLPAIYQKDIIMLQ